MTEMAGSSVQKLRSAETKQEIGAFLQRWPFAWSAAALALRGMSQPRRAAQIRSYIDEHSVRRLRIGAGTHSDPGWLCSDLIPLSKGIVFMDATKALPLPDNSFDFIVSEHMIEHLDLPSGKFMLAECRRVLRAGGVLRIATPDLERVMRCALPENEIDEESREYIAIVNRDNPNVPEDEKDNPAYMINRVVRAWGHQFLYDETTLRHLLAEEGFHDIVRCQIGESEHPDLVGVERHHEAIGERHNYLETLVLEAS